MSNVESIHDQLRNRVAVALMDENGFAPTSAALDVIMAVIRSTDSTDEAFRGQRAPSRVRYLIDAERALRVMYDRPAR